MPRPVASRRGPAVQVAPEGKENVFYLKLTLLI